MINSDFNDVRKLIRKKALLQIFLRLKSNSLAFSLFIYLHLFLDSSILPLKNIGAQMGKDGGVLSSTAVSADSFPF